MKRLSLIIALSAIALLTFFSCRNKEKKQQDTLKSGIIQIFADENLRNIVNAEIDAFSVRYPEAFVFVEYTSEKQAIDTLLKDSTKLVVVARSLDSREQSQLPENRVIRKYPFGYEGVAFIINKQNVDSILTIRQIEQIFLGEIQSWKQINSRSTLDTIRMFFADENGVMRYVSDSITKGQPTKSRHFYRLQEDEDIFAKIAENPNNIGVIGFNQIGNLKTKIYETNTQKISLVYISKTDIRQKSCAALPYAGDVLSGDYPYWRPLYIMLGETRDGLPKGVCFFMTQQVGQKVVQKAGLMPITDAHKVATRWVDE